jgi:hypothetical protein
MSEQQEKRNSAGPDAKNSRNYTIFFLKIPGVNPEDSFPFIQKKPIHSIPFFGQLTMRKF